MVPHSFTSYHPPFHQLPAHFLKSFSLFHLLQSLTWIFFCVFLVFFVYFILKIFFWLPLILYIMVWDFDHPRPTLFIGLFLWTFYLIFPSSFTFFETHVFVLSLWQDFYYRFIFETKLKKLAVLQFFTPYHPHCLY